MATFPLGGKQGTFVGDRLRRVMNSRKSCCMKSVEPASEGLVEGPLGTGSGMEWPRAEFWRTVEKDEVSALRVIAEGWPDQGKDVQGLEVPGS